MSKKKEVKDYLHIVKWDVTIDKPLPIPKGEKNLHASFIGPMVVMKKDVYLNSIYDLYGKDFLIQSLKNFAFDYCKKKNIKCTGEILAYMDKDEFAHDLSNKQVKIKITASKVEILPCKFNISAL